MSDMDIKNEIKAIDDIVMKMDNLSEQEIAMACPGPDNNEVPFCCVANLPKGFDLGTAEAKKWLVYDVSCLHCCLEPCDIKVTISCCGTDKEDTIPGFSVKIVGCIKYMAAAFPVIASSGQLCGGQFNAAGDTVIDDENQGVVCCQGSVCVDKVIGCVTCDGSCTCDCPDINCNNVSVDNFQVSNLGQCNNDQTQVEFSGKFILPGCV